MKQLHLPSLLAASACSAACLALLTMAAPARAQVNAGAAGNGVSCGSR